MARPLQSHRTALDSKAEQLAAALSVDVHPVLHGLVDKAEDFYFCGFHDACAGDKTAQKGIASLIDMSDAKWSDVRKAYDKALRALQKRVEEI